MSKTALQLIAIFLLSFSFSVEAAPNSVVGGTPNTIPTGSILNTLIPSQKKCNYVTDKKYEPFSNIDASFPGAQALKIDADGCVNVAGATENILNLLFVTSITIIIVLTVISISVAGIQYMTEQATGQIKGGAKKRLQNSLIALALGLLSYTILYTINKQLVDFSFNPVSIDINNSISKGITDANIAALSSGASTALVSAVQPLTPTNGYGLSNPSPTGYVNKLTGAPCTQFVGPPAPGAAPDPCVKQDSLVGAYGTGGLGFGGAGTPQAPGTDIQVRFTNYSNPTLARASADGVLTLNGVSYNFRSGGGGNGYLPPGTYTVSNGYLRGTPPSMVTEGFGYSFNLSDAYDPRTGAQRTLLRIHPDSGAPGTLGCIGIQGPRATQEQFYNSLKALLATNGGKYTLRVGM